MTAVGDSMNMDARDGSALGGINTGEAAGSFGVAMDPRMAVTRPAVGLIEATAAEPAPALIEADEDEAAKVSGASEHHPLC